MEVETRLKVIDMDPTDRGRGIVRLNMEVLRSAGVDSGDFIRISGGKKTVARVGLDESNRSSGDEIMMDGTTRINAGVSIDDCVSIDKLMPKQAERIIFACYDGVCLNGGEEHLKRILEQRAFSKGDVVTLNLMGSKTNLTVASFAPTGEAVVIGPDTILRISDKPASDMNVPKISYDDLGGLKDTVKQVREMVELPLRHPELFKRLGVEAPKGVLLHGPPGTGKTMLAKAVAGETSSNFISIGGPEIVSRFYGESEERLREIFNEAEANSPSIIFIDEIDSIAPKRDEVSGEGEKRIVAQLLSLMDGLSSRGKVIIIGATNRPNSIDEALRRPGRFDREIEIGIPDREGRFEILQIHTKGMPLSDNVDLEWLADRTHGYAGADLSALTKEAALASLRRVLPNLDFNDEEIPSEILNSLNVTKEDFKSALKGLGPSTMREVLIEKPDVKWEDIGALETAKQELKEAVEWPMRYGRLYEDMGVRPPRGILLHGPPGTGKTLLAKAVATEANANFISVKGPEFLNKWVGESERAVRETFRKARQASPCVMFLDEIDSIAAKRGTGTSNNVTERVISQILTEMDGLESMHDVVVIAATNRPDMMDPALLRPGRFDKTIYISPPDEASRRAIFGIHTRGKPLGADVNLDDLASMTEGYTGADISAVCNEAAMKALRRMVADGQTSTGEKIRGCISMDDMVSSLGDYGSKSREIKGHIN